MVKQYFLFRTLFSEYHFPCKLGHGWKLCQTSMTCHFTQREELNLHTFRYRQNFKLLERTNQLEIFSLHNLQMTIEGIQDPERGLSVWLETSEGCAFLSCSLFLSVGLCQNFTDVFLVQTTAMTFGRDLHDCFTLCFEMHSHLCVEWKPVCLT